MSFTDTIQKKTLTGVSEMARSRQEEQGFVRLRGQIFVSIWTRGKI